MGFTFSRSMPVPLHPGWQQEGRRERKEEGEGRKEAAAGVTTADNTAARIAVAENGKRRGGMLPCQSRNGAPGAPAATSPPIASVDRVM